VKDLSKYAFSPLRDGEVTLYRGSGNGLPPILLAMAESGSHACLTRLEHEYALRADLDASWAARPIELSRHRNHMALVLEDPGGAVLDRLLGRPLGKSAFLRMAISLAAALRQAHARGIIHKDIKPANVLVEPSSGDVWLTGFGIASRLLRERQGPEAPEIIAGTLAYMAPEQTGRMNRSIDARSDLYSLGITFYQMLTGRLPFIASNPMEWVHCHIARQPLAPGERVAGLPPQLSAIIMKLLAKTAEERYQTAAGVETDLRSCLVEWESHGRIDPFPLGTRDTSDQFLVPERLYGRECEIDALLTAFERVVTRGTPELVLVGGYSGIGKSSLVNELHRVLVPPRGLFASGKFDQNMRDTPYATLAQAFQTLVRQLLVKSKAEMDQWSSALAEAVAPNGALAVNLIPELEFIIGKQPPVPDLPPQDAKNRFQMTFRRFLSVFARKEHPLALFLDDLQWLDTATLDLLQHLLTHSEVRHLLLVGAYRDNEVGSSHPLMRRLETIRKTDARVHKIELKPLALADLGQLVADALRCKPERGRPLAQLVHEKTGGNPFFAIQFLMALYEEGLLAFRSIESAWTWDLDRIDARNYTDNVVDLVVRKLKRLPQTTQDTLKRLACLGNMAEVETLAIAHEQSEDSIHAALREAVRAGIVLHQRRAYRFLHDRIQQAAYSLLPEVHRAATHLRIGRMLLANLTAGRLEERLFEVSLQFNRGASLIHHPAEKAQVATLALRAGRKAKASAAYASAGTYFSAGMLLLEEESWSREYDLTFNLWLERAQCELHGGQFLMAEQLIVELLRRAASKVDMAAVYQVKVLLHTVKSENLEAVSCALACLRLFGIDLPVHPAFECVQAEYEVLCKTLEGRPTETLIDLPLMTDPELQAATQVLSVLGPSAYFTDFQLFCLVACRTVNLGMQHGVSDASTLGFAILGFFIGPVFHRYADAYRFAKLACDLAEKHRFIANQPRIYHATGTVAFWTQPVDKAIGLMRETFRAANETGDLAFACYAMHQVVPGLLLRNDRLDAVWRESEVALEFVRDAKYGDVADIIRSQQRFVATMQGRTASFSTFSDGQFDEAAFEAQLTAERMSLLICFYWILKLKARFLSEDYADALAAADQVKAVLSVATAQIELLDYYYYAALTVAACFENAPADDQTRWRQLLTEHLGLLREWADNYPPTFADKHALVLAEIARIEGRDLDAMRLYDRAIRSAIDNGFVQNEGLSHELAARFYIARGFETIASTYLRNARDCYLRWGADGKVRQLDERYPHLQRELSPSSSTTTIDSQIQHLDLTTVIKVSQAVSGEIVLEQLIDTLMRTSLEHAGAQRGLLIVPHDGAQRLEAEATTRGDTITVRFHRASVTANDLPDSVLRYVVRTRESVILDDASAQHFFSADEYVIRNRVRSVLCLPLLKQAAMVGVLYLENNLTPRAFTPARGAVLKLIASQAAISLENARLYTELKQENAERRRAEDALRRSEAYLAEAQIVSHTGSFGWNTFTGGIYWSAETFRIFAIAPTNPPQLAQIIQQTHPDDRAFVEQVLGRARYENKEFDLEHRLLMPDGSIKHLHVAAHASADQSGNVEYVGVVMDITRRKCAEQEQRDHEREREEMQRQLQQAAKMEAVGRLAGGIAHDFNNILGAILGYGELAQSDLVKGGAARRQIDQVMHAGVRGKELVDRILAFSRSEMGERVPLPVQSIVEETLELLGASMPGDIRLERRLQALELAVVGDATQFHQVVMNLCTNALHAMEGSGVLTVALEHAANTERLMLSHGTLSAGNYVRLLVSDTGSGIPPDVLKRMFDPFFTTKRVGDGTGLGLALVQNIVAEFGGAIDVATQLNVGTTITIWFPAAERAPALLAEPPGALPRGNGETIMIVDDEPALVALAEETLADLGYEPLGFSSSVAALRAFRTEPKRFDLVLTDEMMPDLTGTELAREILRLRPESSIILMSGYGGPQLSERAKAAGVLEVLRKPLIRRDIAEPVARALQISHGASVKPPLQRL
jgi:predicted ATPase/signal transduction histidine kinase/GAF domain-containing protein/ActR/RegA family two-component response regulator